MIKNQLHEDILVSVMREMQKEFYDEKWWLNEKRISSLYYWVYGSLKRKLLN